MKNLVRWLAAGTLGVCAVASAQSSFPIKEYSVERLNLDPAAVDSMVLGGGDLLNPGEYAIRAAVHYEKNPLIFSINGADTATVISDRLSVNLLAAYAPWRWLELAGTFVAIPYQRGHGIPALGVPEVSESGIGSPSLRAKTAILRQHEDKWLSLAGQLEVEIPVGSSAALASTNVPVFTPELVASRDFTRNFEAVLAGGGRLRSGYMLARQEEGSSLFAAASIIGKVENVSLEASLRSDFSLTGGPVALEALGGVQAHFGPFELFALAGPGLSSAPGVPLYRVLGGIGWVPIVRDHAPAAVVVQAPRAPPPVNPCDPGQKHTALQCPDLDDDGDGLANAEDACPLAPGPLAEKGCPVLDTDKDGIADKVDACPTEKGEAKYNGCPAPDIDKDGIADAEDSCPTEAGTVENHGCPAELKQLVVLTGQKLVILEKVHFANGSAKILSSSDGLLDQVASVLQSHPNIEQMVVEGHTDNAGKPAMNRKLSVARAQSVRKALLTRGIDAQRLSAEGFGPDRPVADNDSPEGREANRRVEFRIVEKNPAPASNPASPTAQPPAGDS